MRTDRSDGFVGRNFLMRGAKEHGFYTEETDGVLLDRVKFFWNADYGHLCFTTDHNVIKNCEGYGVGDAVVYPGASPQTGEFRDESFYPEQRYNTVVSAATCTDRRWATRARWATPCESPRTASTATRTGSPATRSRPPGHPGFPADGMQSTTTGSTRTTSTSTGNDPPFEPLVSADADRHGHHLARHERRPRSTTTGSSTTGATARCSIAVPDAVAGEPRATSTRRSTARRAPTSRARPRATTSYFGEQHGQRPGRASTSPWR